MAHFDNLTIARIEQSIRLKIMNLTAQRKQAALVKLRHRDLDDLAKRPKTVAGHDKLVQKLEEDIKALRATLARLRAPRE